jgi:hypothetical protein
LFSESPSRIVISFAAENADKVNDLVADCPFALIGRVADDVLRISIEGGEVISSPVADLEAIWETSLEKRLESGVAATG